MSLCQWCAEAEVDPPGLCTECAQEPDAVEFKMAADVAGVPPETPLTIPLFPTMRTLTQDEVNESYAWADRMMRTVFRRPDGGQA